MASGTIQGTTSNAKIIPTIVWKSTANNEANTSTVTAVLYYKRTDSNKTYGTGSFSVTINGQTTSGSGYAVITNFIGNGVSVLSASATVPHNEDGTKTITISASGSISGTTLESTTCSGSAVLDSIPRGSSITTVPDVTLGNNCSVTWTPRSSAYYYKLKFALESWSKETDAFCPGVTTAYTYTGYTIPLEAMVGLPNVSSGNMAVTLTTLKSDKKTSIGSDSRTFKVTLPNTDAVRPSVEMSAVPMNGNLNSKFSSLYIQGRSKISATLSGEGKYGSKITSYTLRVERDDGLNPMGMGKNKLPNYESGFLLEAGKRTIRGYTHDSRGYMSAPAEQEIYIIPYSKPKLIPVSAESSVICHRCLADGTLDDSGTYLRVRAIRSYSKVESGGTQYNYCLVRYRYKAEGATAFSVWTQLVAKESIAKDEVDAIIPNVVSSTASSYVVEIGVIDDIGEYSTLSYDIPMDKITLHLKEGGNGVAMGKYATKPDTFECDYNAEFNKGITFKEYPIANVVIEEVSVDGWTYRLWSDGTAECWGRKTIAVSITESWGNLFYGRIAEMHFPLTFKEAPICNISAWFGDASQAALMACAGKPTTRDTPAIFMCRPNSDANASFDVNIYAKGKWK